MKSQVAALILSVFVPVALVGCSSSPPPSTGTFNAVTRELEATLDAPLDRAFAAAEKAVKDMKFFVTMARSDALVGAIRADMADGTPVRIDLRKVTDRTALVTIKIGSLGDQAMARSILEQMRKNL